MGLRDDLIELVDEIRDEVIDDEVGLRLHTVSIRTRTWDGGAVGRGDYDDETEDLEPKPKVMDPSPRLLYGQPGTYQEGDRIVSKISATYTAAELVPAGTSSVEVSWLIDGESYIPVSAPQEGYLGWIVHVRRKRK